MLPVLLHFSISSKKNDQIIEMDNHRFRQSIFHRNPLDVWLALLSTPELPGHTQANEAFDEAFSLGKGFLRYGYLDSSKFVKTVRRLNLRDLPAFCVFHPNGQTCYPGNTTGRELVNYAGLFYPDFSKKVEQSWIDDINEPFAILFTEKKEAPFLWRAITNTFYKHPIKIGYSNDHKLAKQLGFEDFPVIVLRNQTHKISYEGENRFIPLKDTIKRFMQKKLYKIPKGLKVHPMSEFADVCKGLSTVCIIDSTQSNGDSLHKLRMTHRTSELEFFYGSDNLPEGLTKGKLYAYRPSNDDYVSFSDVAALKSGLEDILNERAVYTPLQNHNVMEDGDDEKEL